MERTRGRSSRSHRWVVERIHAELSGFGKLRIRFERSLYTYLGLLTFVRAVICAWCVDGLC
uniref:Transposase n=1 Tax=Ralstonia solanacearum TaxID=305 RepID=A0A0S4XJZ8_RALSL